MSATPEPSHTPPAPPAPSRDLITRYGPLAVNLAVLVAVWAFLLSYFRPSLLFTTTYPGGGDTPSFVHPIEHLRDVLLPAGNPQGWDLGNFAGYTPYQFYFIPPSLLVILLSAFVHFNIAFRLVTVAGVFLLPLSAFVAMRALGYRFPVPALASAAVLIFLFNEGNSMWGGNIPSTLAGEFSHSCGFALAVMFVGLLYKHIQTGTRRRSLGVLLALSGLCHPVAFLNAVTPGIFFLLDRQNAARNLRYIIAVYGTATLIMGFWLLPLIVKLGYATSINWTWHFNAWTEIIPKVLQPVAIMAAATALASIVLPKPENRAARYLVFGVVITAIAFYNATSVGLPEIRFVPFAQFLVVMLAVDLVARALRHIPFSLIPALALVAGTFAWVDASVGYIPQWIKWNYSGIESKAVWPTLRKIFDAMQGTLQEPRVAYENSPSYEHFGSMRIFESIPHFANRATLEGVLLQTPVTSPFIYYIQSEVSKAGTGVIPGYPYPAVNAQRGTRRLDLFNARDLLTVTPVVQDALDKDPRWERTFHQKPYAIYRRKDVDGKYVRVPKYEPVLLETTRRRWKKDFHRWFSNDAALDTPLIAGHLLTDEEKARFPHRAINPINMPHVPIEKQCEITERIDHMEIEFTTTCPGVAHWISMSYYPNWHVDGADRVYLASPAFMLVIPNGPRVRLHFDRIGADWFGILASLVGIGLAVVSVRRLSYEPSAFEATTIRGIHPWAVGIITVVVLAVTAFNGVRTTAPPSIYMRGWKAFEKQDFPTAIYYFEWAKRLGGETPQAAEATFFRAASLLRSGRIPEALEGYRDVVENYSDSIWVAEAEFHMGLCLRRLERFKEAKTMFRRVMVAYPGNRWAGFATEHMKELRAAAKLRRPRG
jgi:hypothetical protein